MLTTALVFVFARQLMGAGWKPLLAAALFGLHPAHVEVAAWVAASGDSLLTVFVLASLIFYVRGRTSERGVAWLIASVLFYALAVFAKEPGIFVPVLIVAYEFWLAPVKGAPEGFMSRLPSLAIRVAPFLAVAVTYIYVRISVLGVMSHDALPMPRIVVMQTWPWMLCFYIRHLLWPSDSSLYFNNPYVFERTWPAFWLPVLLLAVTVVFLFMWWRRTRNGLIPFSVVCFLVPLAPTFNINLFQIHDFVHDRFLYLPSVFACLLLAELFAAIPALGREVLQGLSMSRASVMATVLLVFAVQDVRLSLPWASDLLLFTHGIKVSGEHSALAHSNLGWMFYRQGDDAHAATEWEVCLQQYPYWWEMRWNLGNAYARAGRLTEAEQQYLLAAQYSAPLNGRPLLSLGRVLMRMGSYDSAESVLTEAAAKGAHDKNAAEYQETLAECRAKLAAQLRSKGK